MSTDTIDFPDITRDSLVPADVSQPRPTATAVATVRTAALAPLAAMESTLRALAERYRAVAWDVSTPKGLAAAKAARLELRESGRFKVQRAQKATKDELNGAKTELDETAQRLIAITKPTEDDIDAIITAREEAIEAERQKRAKEEADRKARHEANVAEIRANIAAAQGRTSAEIAPVIDALGGMINTFVADPWEEYAPQALAAMGETREALQVLHDRTLAAEQEAAELARQKAEQARIAAEQAEAQRRLDEQAAALRRQQEELAAQAKALEDARAKAEAEAKAAQEAAEAKRIADERAAAPTNVSLPATEPAPQAEVGENLGQPQPVADVTAGDAAAADGTGAEPPTPAESPASAPVASGVIDDPTPAPATTRPPLVAFMETAGMAGAGPVADAGDGSIETSEADAKPWRGALPADRIVAADQKRLASKLYADEAVDRLLVHLHVAMGDTKFRSHPKPAQAWWDGLRGLVAAVEGDAE